MPMPTQKKRLHRRRPPADLATQAQKDVRKKKPDELYRWMVEQSVKRQTIPMPWLVAACQYLGERWGKSTDDVFKQLRAEVRALSGHDMPVESDARGPLA